MIEFSESELEILIKEILKDVASNIDNAVEPMFLEDNVLETIQRSRYQFKRIEDIFENIRERKK